MSHNADLALVTACRDALRKRPMREMPIAGATLSLIEDTLNRHKRIRTGYDLDKDCCVIGGTYWPCEDYRDHLAALHTIATALGVEVST